MTGIVDILNNARSQVDKNMGRKLKDASTSNKFHDTLKSLGADKSPAGRKAEDKRLMDTCIEMESIFVAKMFKEMRNTVHKTKWIHGGFAEEIFEDMLYDEYALNLSKNTDLGIAKMLYNELSRK